ncbi:MAG: DnaJ domain-containing protein [Erysipelotrichaceae bacterium]|nr:DnaJ domain-containing protein [Erysipelotrichaceae bacterium]
MRDPFEVLGVSRNDDMDTINKAYRKLAKQYHPDLHPGDEVCAQKMAEVNAAYESIKKGTYTSYSSSSNNSYSGNYSAEMHTVLNYIQAGRYYEALALLNQIQNRTAQWYYLAGVAYSGMGNMMNALQYLQQACMMDPSNSEYRSAYERIRNRQYTYQQGFGGYSTYGTRGFTPVRSSFGSWLIRMIMLNLFCNCCCRGGVFMGPYYF